MPRVVHVEIPAGDIGRAAAFYRRAFGWEIARAPGLMEYWLVSTGRTGERGIDGAIMDRTITKSTVNTIEVPSLDAYVERIEAAGGHACTPRTEITGVGLFCYCEDTEGNLFGLLEPAGSPGARAG